MGDSKKQVSGGNADVKNNNPTNEGLDKAQKNAQINKDSDVQKRNANLTPRDKSKISNNIPNKSPNNVTNKSSNNLRNNNFNNNSKNREDSSDEKILRKAGSAGLQAYGVPKFASDKIVNSKMADRLLNIRKNINPMLKAKSVMSNMIKEKASEASGSKDQENENNNNFSDKDNDENRIEHVSIKMPLKVKIGAIIVCCFLGIVMVLLIALLNTDTIQKIVANRFSVSIFDSGDSTDEDNNDEAENSDDEDEDSEDEDN